MLRRLIASCLVVTACSQDNIAVPLADATPDAPSDAPADTAAADTSPQDALATDTPATEDVGPDAPAGDVPGDVSGDVSGDASGDALSDASADCASPIACGALWERNAAARFNAVLSAPTDLAAFLRAVPKGGDLHNHLSGAVYAETILGWGMEDGNCINGTTFAAVARTQCATAGNMAIPTSGTFFDQILRSWSMLDFMPGGAESGHDHFFATFGKFGTIAGTHRDDSIADIATRAASENQVYVETMFNLGTNVGSLSASLFSGSVTTANLAMLYETVTTNSGFSAELARDVTAVTNAATRYRTTLGCAGATPPAACNVRVRFTAQIARTAGNDQIFGQLISAFEMASRTPYLVAANLSSPEDDTSSLRNYELHMAMIAFLRERYTATRRSPLHITLHAGEVVPRYLPSGYSTHNTFHIRRAVEVAQAERIGHGLDVMSETDASGLLDLMHTRNVLVEVCLSSNDQILEVRGTDHPLAQYLMHGVPVALSTDDQGVSRSSLGGEYARAVRDQHLDYLQLKAMARNSLEHAFLPGASLWSNLSMLQPVAACAPSAVMGLGDAPEIECEQFLNDNERAAAQWELERRFRTFERAQ